MTDETDEEEKNRPHLDETRNPVTGEVILDPILRLAVKEGHYRIVKGKLRIHWAGLMESRRTYNQIPDYGRPLTPNETELLRKLRADTFIGVSIVSELLGYKTLEAGIKFLLRREVPIYRIAGTYRVLSGDVLRAIESCRLETDGGWGVWERYLKSSYAWRDRQKRRK